MPSNHLRLRPPKRRPAKCPRCGRYWKVKARGLEARGKGLRLDPMVPVAEEIKANGCSECQTANYNPENNPWIS